ncbi:MAG: hypothetical protein IT260_11050 [Saprospiraceae bacterium]|nr:hypothetical protein [Saprospiraceae bacterium]
MKNFLFALFCLTLMAACNSGEKSAATATTAPAPAIPPAVPKAKFAVHCFEQHLPDSSVFSLHYTVYYETIVGILDYTFTDKDGAHGTFTGTLTDNVISATWNYSIEGSEQTEEILIKIEGDKAYRGYGELQEGKDGHLTLKDPSQVKWEDAFTRVQCD